MKKMMRQIYRQIKKYKTIIITRHIGPDPDALGSQLGLREMISNTFPNKNVYAVGLPTSKFKFMGKLDKMCEEYYEDSLLIVLDTPDLKRVDGVDPTRFKYSIKIDHHPFMEQFCDLEWIDSSSSSVCQMLIELSFKTRLKINEKAAENFFVGLVADTDRFLYDYTSIKTFDLTKKLLEKTKININPLYEQLYMRTLNEIRLQGHIALNLTVTEHGVAYIILTNDIIEGYNVDVASAGNLINNFNFIEEVLIWLTVSEDKKQDTIRVNIRSRGPIINTIAESYNGGGHKFASGARLNDMEEVHQLVAELDELSKIYQGID